MSKQVVFKSYQMNQLQLLPPSLEELIAEHHPVRVVNKVIDQINIDPLLAKFKGGGTSSYHPRMLLKVLVYGYLSNIYSSRKIEEAIKENIHFMWLSGSLRPDHNTINRFRSDKLQHVLKDIFSQIVLLLAQEGLLSLKQAFTDGTKLESAAGRYTFVWGKSIQNNKERIGKQVNELWEYAQAVAAEEMKDTSPISF
ncbi:MAG TPA: transposase, partial [Adhaeribacter sp.]|nr:transposase [Adhaeribacter sp.]